MQNASVWQAVLGLVRTVIEAIDFDEEHQALVVSVRPRKKARERCGRCGRRSPYYDRGEGRRRWRSLDLGTVMVWLEADAPRVRCRDHGPTVMAFPWARHGAWHTRDFDETVAWLAVRTSKAAVGELMRVAWRSVGAIITRVAADLDAVHDRLEGLRRIGIDEISYKKGQRYLVVVIDHDTGRLVWAAPGRDRATLRGFFDLLGDERAALLTHVSADGADWIAAVVAERCPQAVACMDPFHVVAWATKALDEVRRSTWNRSRGGRPQDDQSLRRNRFARTGNKVKQTRWALWKNPEDLTEPQRHQLEWIAGNEPVLWRAYRLKEGLRYVFAVKGEEGKEALDRWLGWASRSRIQAFVELAQRIRRNRTAIDNALEHGLSNARSESTNTKIRLFTRMAFGYHSAQPLIAIAMLSLGHPKPALPGRK